MDNITFQYPTYYIIACLALGLLGAFLLYWREKKFSGYTQWVLGILAFLRFLAISGLAALLLSPLIKSDKEEIKSPKIILLEDISESVTARTKPETISQYETALALMKEKLAEKYDLSTLQFGSQVIEESDTSSQLRKISNLSQALEQTQNLFADQNIGSVILLTDGLFNEGRNPLYQNLQFEAPLHTVGLGDTTIQRDLSIQQVLYNKVAYLGDKFAIQVDVQAFNAGGQKPKLSISRNNNGRQEQLHSSTLEIKGQDHFQTINAIIDAAQPGINQYRISISQIDNEATYGNNIMDIYVDVLDARQKILLLANAPHPDVAAFNQILNINKNYVVDIKYAQQSFNVADYDLVILHGLPSKLHNIDATLKDMNERKKPRLFVVTNQTDLSNFNKSQDCLTINGGSRSSNEVQAVFADKFNLFELSDAAKNALKRFPPLSAAFGEYTVGPRTHVLFNQKIGAIATAYPLISFSESGGLKTGVISSEGIWKWKLFDFLQHQNFDIVSEILRKSITYITVKEDKRKFRASPSKILYKENEHVQFAGQLYNNNYELVNDPEVSLKIQNEKKESFEFYFSKSEDAYQLDAGIFPAGRYSYNASTVYHGQNYNESGSFTIQEIQLELYNLNADHQLLRSLSQKQGGQFYTIDRMGQLTENLLTDESIKPIIYTRKSTKTILHYQWLFFLLAGLLLLEWFLRRYFGSY